MYLVLCNSSMLINFKTERPRTLAAPFPRRNGGIWYDIAMILLLLSLLLFVVAGFVFWRLWRAFALFRIRRALMGVKDLPSVSVCIPARNEMHALASCLEKVLASDYEKLEILVFDDSSADDTSVLIKSFAHEGVRFVPGTHLPEGWLGKNHALEVLAREASGKIIVFMDIDTHIEPTTISRIVSFAEDKSLEMISVLPFRADAFRASVLFGSLRYFWQLVFPGAHHPATSSAFWMIRRRTLLEMLGGFLPFSSSVEPEAHIARRLSAAYQCLISGRELGVNFEKKWSSQIETGRRLLYPQFGGKWWAALIGIAVLALLNTPTILVLCGLVVQWTTIHTLALIILGMFMGLYGIYTSRMWQGGWWLGVLLWPYLILQEFILFILSVYSYWSGTVTWKGRSVTVAKAGVAKEV